MGLILGVDPGRTGAAVAITEAGKLASWLPASWQHGSLSEHVFRWLDDLGLVEAAAIEEPVMMFRDGHAIHKSATAVAMSVGQWKGMLAALGIRGVRLVPPRTWMATVLGRIEKGQSKHVSMRWAALAHGTEMERAIRETGDGVADAAGIAEWLRLEVAAERVRDRAILAEARRC